MFSAVSYFLDPLANRVGYMLLVDARSLTPFWTWLYNQPLLPFTRFYNTLVMGSLVVGIILFIPLFIAVTRFIVYYRANLKQRVEAMQVIKLFKLSSIFQLYSKYK